MNDLALQETIGPLIKQGRYADALPQLRAALAANAGNGIGQFWAGLSVYLTGGSPPEALNHFNAALALGYDPYLVLLNRGILYAEAGGFAAAEADFTVAGMYELAPGIAADFAAQTRRNLCGAGSARDLYYKPPHLPHLDAIWLETCSLPQSTQFMIDCLPAIRSVLRSGNFANPVEVLDVGTASAAGPALLAGLHSGAIFGAQLRVDAMDLIKRYRGYASKAFPLVHYICANLFDYQPDRRWDIVLCSHTIEHMDDPLPLIRECQRRARRSALFYAPYEEQALISGHLRSIGKTFVEELQPAHVEILESPGWQHPVDPVSRTVLFVLEGRGE